MKTSVKFISALLLTATMSTFLSSCGDDNAPDNSAETAIVGTWAVKNISCFNLEKLSADILTFTDNKRMEAKHYIDETGYGIFKYDDTYSGSWSVDGNKIQLQMSPSWVLPNSLKIATIQESRISVNPWGDESAYATMEKFTEPENSIYGYWELSGCTGTLTKEDGTVLYINDGSFIFHYLYFSKTELQNHRGYNGVILDRNEKSPKLINYDFDGSKIIIYKTDKGTFLDGDFVVKSVSTDHAILHFYGHDAPNEIFDIDMYLNRVPTFLNQ